jgi:hypothetical protein
MTSATRAFFRRLDREVVKNIMIEIRLRSMIQMMELRSAIVAVIASIITLSAAEEMLINSLKNVSEYLLLTKRIGD